MAELTNGAATSVALPPAEQKRFNFADIELAPDMERVLLYLNKTRGLSVELIAELIRRRQLFQEAKTNNAIFPIYDGGAIVGAELVGTVPGKRFKGIKALRRGPLPTRRARQPSFRDRPAPDRAPPCPSVSVCHI